MSSISAAGAPSGPDADESLQLATLLTEMSLRRETQMVTTITSLFLPIPDAVALDATLEYQLGGEFTKLLDTASMTLPGFSESTDRLLRIRTLFNRIRSYDPSIEEAFYFSDVKSKLQNPGPRAFLKAAHAGDLTILKLYLENGATISEEDWARAISNALYRGRYKHDVLLPDLISLALANGGISQTDRGKAVCEAIGLIEDSAKVISSLLTHGPISQKDRGKAVCEAARKGHVDVLLLLLKSEPISQEDRGIALSNASCQPNPDVVSLLLESGPISQKDRGKALYSAASRQTPDFVSLLWGDGAAISQIDKDTALSKAALNGNLAVVSFFLDNGPISQENRGEAVISAACHGCPDTISRLLADGAPISQEDRGTAVCAALNERFGGTVLFGLNAQRFHNAFSSASDAGRTAAYRKHPALLPLLLSEAISDKSRGEAVLRAAYYGHVDVLPLLLKSGPISEEDRDTALAVAHQEGHEAIIDLLQRPV